MTWSKLPEVNGHSCGAQICSRLHRWPEMPRTGSSDTWMEKPLEKSRFPFESPNDAPTCVKQ